MNKMQETCVQRVKVVFFHPSSKSSKGFKPHCLKLEKIYSMIHSLQKAHDDWSIYATNHQIVLETTTLDFNIISEMLEQNGFTHSDYDLRVEYERKWGML